MKLELVESRKNLILAMISVVSTNNIESLNLALEGDLGVIEIEIESERTEDVDNGRGCQDGLVLL